MSIIPYSKQKIDSDDINAVQKVLASDFITQGPKINEFERAIADYCGTKYAVAVANGSAALHLAALAAGLKAGDEAITTPITFLATANAVLYAGGTPVFADIDYDTANIDPDQIKRLVTRKTKAILPVDLAGLPCAIRAIHAIAARHGLTIIQDASHALGSESQGEKVGSCRFSDMTIFSFHPVKHITTGEGGCITTNNKKYYEKLKALRSHGVYRLTETQQKLGTWYYEMKELGFNYRITDFQCALGLSQLSKLEDFIKRRIQIARRYDAAFSEFGEYLKVPAQQINNEKHVWHLYLLRLRLKKPSAIRRSLFEHLRSNGIYAQVHYIPIYKQPFYRKLLSGKKVNCPNADRYYDEVLSLPIFPSLSESETEKTISTVKDFFKKFNSKNKGAGKRQRDAANLVRESV